eukprot:jgi/Chlat1/5374/Chrsp35S05216
MQGVRRGVGGGSGVMAAARLAAAVRSYAGASGSLNVAAIRELRERSGAAMIDVKAALEATGGDIDRALTELRKKGQAAVAKKAKRTAAEGLLGLAKAHDNRSAAVVEVNSETDFVAKNDRFQRLVGAVAQAALQCPAQSQADHELPLAAVEELSMPEGEFAEHGVRDAVAGVAATVGENVRLRRVFRLTEPNGVVASYLHTSPQPGLGRMAGVVALQLGDGADTERAMELGARIAMHTVAARPQFLTRESVTNEALEAELEVLRAQASSSGKPPHIVEKMVAGRIGKYYEEVVLLEQKYIVDETKKIKDLLKAAQSELGGTVDISGFIRVQCGEGIERETKDFAAEVAAQAGL